MITNRRGGIHLLSGDSVANAGMHQNGYDKISGLESLGPVSLWREGDPYWISIKAVGGNAAITGGGNMLLRVTQVIEPQTSIIVCMFPGDIIFGRFKRILCGPLNITSTPPAMHLLCGRGGGTHE